MEKDKQDQMTALAWKILYNEEYESIPDPNKEENVPYMKAKKKERSEAFRRLMEGPGKVLFAEWKKKIKQVNTALLFIPATQLCTCHACMLIRGIRGILELWLEAEQSLLDDKIVN